MARLSDVALLLGALCSSTSMEADADCLLQSAKQMLPRTSETLEVEPKDKDRTTSWRCVGDGTAVSKFNNRSCVFKNLYYSRMGNGNGDFVMFLPQGQSVADIEVHRADKYGGPWKPRVKSFASVQEINDYVASQVMVEPPGLSVQFDPLFHHNIGHGLFDGLYPAYMALIRLGMQDNDFRPVIGVPAGCLDTDVPAPEGNLKPGDVVQAYLHHASYNKTLQPSKVEILEVSDKSQPSSEDASNLCSFESGLDSSAESLGSKAVSGGKAGHAECCKACELTFGCTSAVIVAGTCYLKGTCFLKGTCDAKADDRLLCRFNQTRRPQEVNLSVRRIDNSSAAAGLDEHETIPMSWVVERVRQPCMAESIYETFGKSQSMLRLHEMDRDIRANPNILFRFEEIVIGVGGAGNMVADVSGAIGGSSAPDNAMIQFRDRMLEAYGLPVEQSSSPADPNKPLNVMVVSNKRFNQTDEATLDNVMKTLRVPGSVDVELVDWRNIGTPENRFRAHLQRVQQADVYVSSIGTALQYVPFMRDQRVYVALGSVWQRSEQLFPTFMEQQLAGGGTPYLRTLYADPGATLRSRSMSMIGEDGFRANVDADIVLGLLKQAVSLVRQGFRIPVAIEENLSTEGRVMLELCEQDPEGCKLMTADRNGAAYECALLLWPECVVYEVGPWRNASACNLNRSLLRQLRKKHGLFSYGAPEI